MFIHSKPRIIYINNFVLNLDTKITAYTKKHDTMSESQQEKNKTEHRNKFVNTSDILTIRHSL